MPRNAGNDSPAGPQLRSRPLFEEAERLATAKAGEFRKHGSQILRYYLHGNARFPGQQLSKCALEI